MVNIYRDKTDNMLISYVTPLNNDPECNILFINVHPTLIMRNTLNVVVIKATSIKCFGMGRITLITDVARIMC